MRFVALAFIASVLATGENEFAADTDAFYAKIQEHGFGNGHMGIVNGTLTNYQHWNGTVAVRIRRGGGSSMCTGSFIDPEVILTAAHCCTATIGGTSGYDIYGGADVNHPVYDRGFLITTAVQYNLLSTGYPANDICTIKVARAVTERPYYDVRANTNPGTGSQATMVGYGITSSTSPSRAGVHRMGSSTVVSTGGVITIRGGPQGVCSGDSGGPLFIFDQNRNKFTIAGVASTASFPCSATGTGNYPSTASARNWINDRVRQYTGHNLRDDGAGSAQ